MSKKLEPAGVDAIAATGTNVGQPAASQPPPPGGMIDWLRAARAARVRGIPAKALLVTLAGHVRRDGTWGSDWDALAVEIGGGRRATMRAGERLRELGVLAWTHTRRPDGYQGGNKFRLSMSALERLAEIHAGDNSRVSDMHSGGRVQSVRKDHSRVSEKTIPECTRDTLPNHYYPATTTQPLPERPRRNGAEPAGSGQVGGGGGGAGAGGEMREWLARLKAAGRWQGVAGADKALSEIAHEVRNLHPDERELLVKFAQHSGTKYLSAYLRSWDARLDDARRHYVRRPMPRVYDVDAAPPDAADRPPSIREQRQAAQARLPRTIDPTGCSLPGTDNASRDLVERAADAIYSAADQAAIDAALVAFNAEWIALEAMPPDERAVLNAAHNAKAERDRLELNRMLASLSAGLDEPDAAPRSVLETTWNAVSVTTRAA